MSALLLNLSCAKEPVIKEADFSLLHCHETREWNKIKIEEQLLGRWRWVFQACPEDGNRQNTDSYKGQIVEFKKDKTLIITYDGKSPVSGTYGVTQSDGNLYQLIHSPETEFLKGNLLFCNDELECSNVSATDGCTHFLKKTF